MYVGEIIRLARQMTDNIDWAQDTDTIGGVPTGNPTEGITDDLILSFINDGKDYLSAKIFGVCPDDFSATKTIPLVNEQEAYDVDDNLFLNNRIISVRYSPDGALENYRPLKPKTMQERDTRRLGTPAYYIRLNRQILINPIYTGTSGTAEVTYYRAIDNLDVRRGKISNKSAGPNIVLTCGVEYDSPALGRAEYVCLVDKHGVVKDYNVEVSSYSVVAHTITTTASTLNAAVGDYVVCGKYTTTHSELSTHCARYLKVYAQKRMFAKDSSNDSIEEDAELTMIFNQIIEAYSDSSQDPIEVPLLDDNLAG